MLNKDIKCSIWTIYTTWQLVSSKVFMSPDVHAMVHSQSTIRQKILWSKRCLEQNVKCVIKCVLYPKILCTFSRELLCIYVLCSNLNWSVHFCSLSHFRNRGNCVWFVNWREGISDPSSARLAVTKTKDISCDGALQLLSRVKKFCHHVSAESGVNSCDGASHLLWGSVLHWKVM